LFGVPRLDIKAADGAGCQSSDAGSGSGKARSLIAMGDSKGHKPIQIRAEVLRSWKPSRPFDGRQGFATMADDREIGTNEGGGEAGWRDEDLKRAIAVAEEAGLTSYRIEIAPDGTITIFVGGLSQNGE